MTTTVAWVAESVDPQMRQPGEIQEDLRRLGATLLQRTGEVIEEITGRAHDRMAFEGAPQLDRAVEERFVRLGTLATAAVARWLAGESIDLASAAGAEFSRVFAQLVASSDIGLGEVVRRCRYWRDGCDLALREAAELGLAGDEALSCARETIHRAADHALAQMSAIFDGERHRIQAELTHRQEELAFLATHDSLTTLANRTLIIDRLRMMLTRCEREGGAVEVLFVDLDDFKVVNDTFGHAAGDELLVAVARRLRSVVREADTLGRLGGDEFVVLAEARPLDRGPRPIAERILSAFARPFSLSTGEGSLRVGASVGVARSKPGDSPQQMLYDADMAMYCAKACGSGRAGRQDRAQQSPPAGRPHQPLGPARPLHPV